jgi:hypothetical protein
VIDRGKVHALAGDKAGLDEVEQFLARVRAEKVGIVRAAARFELLLRWRPVVDRAGAAATACDWLDLQEDWRQVGMARARALVPQLDRCRAILACHPHGRHERKVAARRRSLRNQLNHELAEWLAILGLLDRSTAGLPELLPVRLNRARRKGSLMGPVT